MLYASSRARTIQLAEREAGIIIAKRMEATDPEDISEEAVLAELKPQGPGAVGPEAGAAGGGGGAGGFARPKRPGRR